MPAKKSNYEILGITSNASEADIKRAYRKLASKYHPDRYSDEDEKKVAEESFKEVSNAYDELTKKPSSNWTPEEDDYSYKADDLSAAFNKAVLSFYEYKRTVEDLDSLSQDARWEGFTKRGFLRSIFFKSAGLKDADRTLAALKKESLLLAIIGEDELNSLELFVNLGLGGEFVQYIDEFSYQYDQKNSAIKDCLDVIRGNKKNTRSFRP